MAITYTWDHIKKIREQPHLLGHLGGKTLLTPMHSQWIRYIFDTKKHRSLQAHRGSYKSTSILEVGIPWHLLFNPSDRIAIVRKTYTAAAEVVRSIANFMEHPMVRPVFELAWGTKWSFTVKRDGKLTLSVKQTSTPQGSIEALGLDSNIVGKHYDWVLLDDFVDINDRISEAERNKTIMLVQEIASNIVDRGKPTSYIGTPWDKHDAWTVCPPALKYPISKTGLVFPEEEAAIREKTTPLMFACNYELYFESEADLLFANPRIGTWQKSKVTNIKAHLDAAYQGEHWNALTIMGQLPGGKINAIGFCYHGNIKDWLDVVVMKLLQYNCRQFYTEDNADKGFSADIIRMHPEARKSGIWVDTYHEKTNKHVKISSFLYDVWKNIEWADASDPLYLEMVKDYREDQEPDDCPDSAASLIREGGYSTITDYGSSGIWEW